MIDKSFLVGRKTQKGTVIWKDNFSIELLDDPDYLKIYESTVKETEQIRQKRKNEAIYDQEQIK